MLYHIYGKSENMRQFKALDLTEGCFVNCLMYATLLDSKEIALKICNELSSLNPKLTFEVRKA